MKITLLNALSNTNGNSEFNTILDYYKTQFPDAEYTVFNLSDSVIKDCIGCWNCWVKTPGICCHQDDYTQIYSDFLASDRAVFLFPTQNGFISGHSKAIIDRLIPLYHPYIQIHAGEMMHQYRYKHYPQFDFFWHNHDLTQDENQVLEDYFYRSAHHFRVSCNALYIEDHTIRMYDLTPREPKEDTLWQSYSTLSGSDTLEKESDSIVINKSKIILYNGSPRGKKGNSLILIEEIIKGLKAAGTPDDAIEVRHLVDQKQHIIWAEDFHQVQRHIFVFPLYVHSMPSVVMKFFSKLQASPSGETHLTFFVQSGFMEAYQSTYLRAYLPLLCKRLDCLYGGTLIRGGVEGIQIMPAKMTQKLFDLCQEMGRTYISEKGIPQTFFAKLANTMKLSRSQVVFFKLLAPTGLFNTYWNGQLKKNKVYDKRNATPYGQ